MPSPSANSVIADSPINWRCACFGARGGISGNRRAVSRRRLCRGISTRSHHVAAAMAARLDVTVATPAYTLASERPFPAAAEDAYAAITWAAASPRAARAGTARRLVVAGVEAGRQSRGRRRDDGARSRRTGARRAGSHRADARPDAHLAFDAAHRGGGVALASANATRATARICRMPPDRLHPYAAPSSCSRVTGTRAGADPHGRGRSAARRSRSLWREAHRGGRDDPGFAPAAHRSAPIDTWTDEAWIGARSHSSGRGSLAAGAESSETFGGRCRNAAC